MVCIKGGSPIVVVVALVATISFGSFMRFVRAVTGFFLRVLSYRSSTRSRRAPVTKRCVGPICRPATSSSRQRERLHHVIGDAVYTYVCVSTSLSLHIIPSIHLYAHALATHHSIYIALATHRSIDPYIRSSTLKNLASQTTCQVWDLAAVAWQVTGMTPGRTAGEEQ